MSNVRMSEIENDIAIHFHNHQQRKNVFEKIRTCIDDRLIATSQKFEKYQEFDLKKSNQILKVEFETCLDVKFKFLILASNSNSSRNFRLEV